MKLQILIALCMVAAALGYQSCKSNTECAATECCERNPTRYNLRRGRCYPNQIQEGEECHPSFTGQCGCVAGLECVTEAKMTEMQFAYKTHTCQKIMEGSGHSTSKVITSVRTSIASDSFPSTTTPTATDLLTTTTTSKKASKVAPTTETSTFTKTSTTTTTQTFNTQPTSATQSSSTTQPTSTVRAQMNTTSADPITNTTAGTTALKATSSATTTTDATINSTKASKEVRTSTAMSAAKTTTEKSIQLECPPNQAVTVRSIGDSTLVRWQIPTNKGYVTYSKYMKFGVHTQVFPLPGTDKSCTFIVKITVGSEEYDRK